MIFAAGAASISLAAPASAAESGPNLQVSVVVTPVKASYAVGDVITTTFVVKNTGTATATNVRVYGGDDEFLDRAAESPTDPFDLPAGESRSIAWAGTLNQFAAILGYAYGSVGFTDDQGQEAIGHFRIEPVPGMTGTLTGEVFTDLKGNYDSAQPKLAGVTVTATNNYSGELAATATTNNAGQFSMPNLAAGDYQVRVVGRTIEGEARDFTLAQVKGGQVSRLSVAVVPVSGTSTPTPTSTVTATTTSTATATTASTATATTSAPTATATSTPAAAVTGAGSTSAVASSGTGGLPVTGGSTGLMAAIGVGVVLVGVGALVISRRRRDGAPAPTDG
jgi:LPXTG-motif cell wall-anchored protein